MKEIYIKAETATIEGAAKMITELEKRFESTFIENKIFLDISIGSPGGNILVESKEVSADSVDIILREFTRTLIREFRDKRDETSKEEIAENNVYERTAKRIIKIFANEMLNLNEANHVLKMVRDDIGDKSIVMADE